MVRQALWLAVILIEALGIAIVMGSSPLAG
jgi:hypothetical protein